MNLFKPKNTDLIAVSKKGGASTLEKHGKEHFRKIGKKGRATIKKKYGKEFYKNLSRKGVEARLAKKNKEKKATQSPVDTIADMINGK